MKVMLLLLTITTIISPMHNQHLYAPKPLRAHQLYAQRHTSQLPMDLLRRPGTPRQDRPQTPPRHQRVDEIMNEYRNPHLYESHAIQIPSPMTPEQEVHVEEVRAHAVEVRAMSKKKIACLVAASAITSAVLTAAVTLTIHFTDCKK